MVFELNKYHLCKALITEYFWVILFSLFVLMLYHQASEKKMATYARLEQDLSRLKKEHQLALEKQEDLQLQIKSQDDPLWLQLVLMKKLGVTPQGQTKVHFLDPSPN